MQTSAKGVAFLERHEGVVLRAYRDPVGIWTIGAGLTAASGVVKPKAGMVITRTEASRLLKLALNRNYEPAVAQTMPGASQHEFDGGVSFHFNTGAIGRASWVQCWRRDDWPGVKKRLALWNKAGGKVLPGLTRRREEEFNLIQGGFYGIPQPEAPAPELARWGLTMTQAEREKVRASLATLRYAVGNGHGAVALEAAKAFQRDHGLTADGIIGRATLSTLQRVLDSRVKAATTAPVAALGAAEIGTDGMGDLLAGLPAGEMALGVAMLRYAWLAWTYRDTIAAVAAPHMPRVAALLRSF